MEDKTPDVQEESTEESTPRFQLPALPRWVTTRLLLWIAGFSIAGIVVLLMLFFWQNSPDFTDVRSVKIPAGSSFEQTCDSLTTAGLLSSRTTFTLAATVTLWRKQIKPGYYEFEEPVSNYAILNRLRKGLQTPLRVTIPAGSRPERVAGVLEQTLEIDRDEFLETLKDSQFAEELGTDTSHLFGYLMPETYFVFWGTDSRALIRRIKRDFENRLTEEIRAELTNKNLTVDQALSLASIVEWETPKEAEKPIVAGVYWNRLQRGMRLQADPTVQYALMETDGGIMRRLLYRDYEFVHPYNTYVHDGLPPGPITNPSFSSFMAAVNPQSHEFIYFVADGTGGHLFSRTHQEHINRARAYQALMRDRRREQAQQ